MGICASCLRGERKVPEKSGSAAKRARSKGAAAELLPPSALQFAMANSISNMKMTNPIKGMVSKRRKRYIKDGFNLDLAYITDRLIAMGFPAEKLEGVYRNHIDEVYRFLEQKHQNHYKIYNLCSERSYDSSKFHERVVRYAFEDHCPPKMELIQPFCEDVDKWLAENPKNVAAVHCKAGKGRTGTMVCCYLLYSGQKATADEALNYYGTKRTHDEKGVTIPSQRRYVEYYAWLVRSPLSYCRSSALVRELALCPAPSAASLQLHLYQHHPPMKAPMGCVSLRGAGGSLRLPLDHCTPLSGDVRVEVYHKPKMMRKEKLFHFWFNTFFVLQEVGAVRVPPVDSVNLETFKLTLNKWQLDDIHKNKQHKLYHPDFKVELIIQKQPESSKFTGNTSMNRNSIVSPPSSSDSSCSDPEDEPDEHWDSGEQTNYQTYYALLDDTSSNRSTATSITDLTKENDGKIPKVSSDHTLSSTDCERLYEPTSKSPTDSGKKKYLFFKKDEDDDKKNDIGNNSKPRLSLGDMRASWREFSGKHFGAEHGKHKKKNGQDSKDNG